MANESNGRPGKHLLPDPELVKKLEEAASECYQSILMPINERMMGPLPQVCACPASAFRGENFPSL
jgi:hypothetical protein